MSRARNSDEHTAVQLFPFVAVLLCTMGSLMVLLVVIARSARVHAIEAAATTRAAAAAKTAVSPAEEIAAKKKLEQIAGFRSQLEAIRAQAAEKLRQDQLRLSHLEDHMQRLRDQLASLQLAAAELNSLEGEHYDDRQQAEREIERLQQLIAESRKTIDGLRAEMKQRPKSYAIVPYQGNRGTSRRPIYIECFENEVVLQPEGVKLTLDDFRPPIGPGNPLVAALRAAREYIHRIESNPAVGKEAEPYPLIIVRPKGIRCYYAVREAIQSWDSEFGYELVEDDWNLKFSAADPQLASLEYQATELARNRLKALAAAAPGAYRAYRSYGDDEEYAEYNDEPSGYGSQGDRPETGQRDAGDTFVTTERGRFGSQPGGSAVGGSAPGGSQPGSSRAGVYLGDSTGTVGTGGELIGGVGAGDAVHGAPIGQDGADAAGHRTARNGAGASATDDDNRAIGNDGASGGVRDGATLADKDANQSSVGQANDDRYAAGGSQTQASPGASQGGISQSSQSATPLQAAGPESPESSVTASSESDADRELDELARQAAAKASCRGERPTKTTKARGKNWAIASAGPGMIPIRRTIQVVIREDALAILDEQSATKAAVTGREFKFQDSPEAAYEEMMTALEAKIKDWGMAGDGLYWRPVVELKVGVGGERRTSGLLRLLRNGGFEVRNGSVARQDEGGANGANR